MRLLKASWPCVTLGRGEEAARGFRLNSWQRVGMVLSVLWVLVGAWLVQQAVYGPVRAGYSKCISLGVAPSICKTGLDNSFG
jgi:hypothetical protein